MGRSKYGAVKIEIDGILFDSKIEGYFYGLLKQYRLTQHVTLQEHIELQPKYKCSNGENIRAITTRIDYVFRYQGHVVYIDTKGMITSEFKMKWKMLRYQNRMHANRDYYLPNSHIKCMNVIAKLVNIIKSFNPHNYVLED